MGAGKGGEHTNKKELEHIRSWLRYHCPRYPRTSEQLVMDELGKWWGEARKYGMTDSRNRYIKDDMQHSMDDWANVSLTCYCGLKTEKWGHNARRNADAPRVCAAQRHSAVSEQSLENSGHLGLTQ